MSVYEGRLYILVGYQHGYWGIGIGTLHCILALIVEPPALVLVLIAMQA